MPSKFRDSGQRAVGFEGDRPAGFDGERASADCQIPRWGPCLGPDRCLDPDHRWTPSSLFPLGSPVPAEGAAGGECARGSGEVGPSDDGGFFFPSFLRCFFSY